MNKVILKEALKGTFIVPVGLAIILAPYSLLLRWNLPTMVLFWFVLLPGLAVYLPKRISKNRNHLVESILGILLFYGLMVFMIYKHYRSDFFQLMIISCLVNLLVVLALHYSNRQGA